MPKVKVEIEQGNDFIELTPLQAVLLGDALEHANRTASVSRSARSQWHGLRRKAKQARLAALGSVQGDEGLKDEVGYNVTVGDVEACIDEALAGWDLLPTNEQRIRVALRDAINRLIKKVGERE